MKDKNTRVAYRGNNTKLLEAFPHAKSASLAARDLVEFALTTISIELHSLRYQFTEAELELLASTVTGEPMRPDDRFHKWSSDLHATINQSTSESGVTPERAYALISAVEALGKTQQAALTVALERYRVMYEPKSFARAGIAPKFTGASNTSQASATALVPHPA